VKSAIRKQGNSNTRARVTFDISSNMESEPRITVQQATKGPRSSISSGARKAGTGSIASNRAIGTVDRTDSEARGDTVGGRVRGARTQAARVSQTRSSISSSVIPSAGSGTEGQTARAMIPEPSEEVGTRIGRKVVKRKIFEAGEN
jgi:hypothetical protein